MAGMDCWVILNHMGDWAFTPVKISESAVVSSFAILQTF